MNRLVGGMLEKEAIDSLTVNAGLMAKDLTTEDLKPL
jgi:hypothetical protein